jgi:hypothetical protein
MLLTLDNVPVLIPNIKTQSSSLIRLYQRTFNKPVSPCYQPSKKSRQNHIRTTEGNGQHFQQRKFRGFEKDFSPL